MISKLGRIVLALVASAALGLGMTACGGGTIGYLWVVGQFRNEISGFKIDNYTGNLTGITRSPFTSGGTNPVTIIVKPGGRFLYVINQGSPATQPVAPVFNAQGVLVTPGVLAKQSVPGNIAQFTVGGDGTLTFIQSFSSQGIQTTWATFDTTGNFLYVLDKYGPDPNNPFNGSITAFQSDGDNGRLSLVVNQAIKNNGLPTSFFSVPANSSMVSVGAGNCLYTLEPNQVYPYVVTGSNGQLTLAQTGPQLISGALNLNSINSTGSNVYLTDASPAPSGQIFSLTAGGAACSLSPVNGSQQANIPLTGTPVNSIVSASGMFLYVINQSTNGTTANANSTISAFTITAGKLAPIGGADNPYSIGSGPVCVVQSPSANSQYLYTSNNTDSTITGKIINQGDGRLSPLQRGSTFPTTLQPKCLAVSGAI